MPMPDLEMPKLPIEGGCQCGQVRYALTGVPVVFYLCHCRECQRHTSSAFGESLRVRRADLHVRGTLKLTTRVSEAGNLREGHFCPECGVRIVHGTAGAERVNIKAGTLDDPAWLVPAGHIWTRSRQRFFAIGADELTWEADPGTGGMDMLQARWQQMLAKT